MATLEAKFEAKRWPVGASKPDISPASFCAWLEKQRGAYDVNHLRWCAIAQWLRAMGMDKITNRRRELRARPGGTVPDYRYRPTLYLRGRI